MATRYAKDQPQGFTNRIERVAIVGAGGKVGKHIAEALLKMGKHTVTAVTRIDSQNELPEGVKIAKVDYENEQTLVDALKDIQFLFVSLAFVATPGTQDKLIKAAKKAGVPWIMPNCYGVDITNRKLVDENMTGRNILPGIEAAEKAGLSWVTMCCSFWYEYSLAMGPGWYGFDFNNKKVTFYDDGKTRINTSTWLQCGRAAAGLLSLKELPEDENDKSPTISQWRNKPLYISSFLASQRDMLDSAHRVLGTTDADWTIEYEPSEARYQRGFKMMNEGSLLGSGMTLYSRTFFPNGDGNFEAKHGLANEALGLPKEDIDVATKKALELVDEGLSTLIERLQAQVDAAKAKAA